MPARCSRCWPPTRARCATSRPSHGKPATSCSSRARKGTSSSTSCADAEFCPALQRQILQVVAEACTQHRVLQRQLHIGLQEAFLAAAVVAPALVAVGEHLLAAQQAGDAVGELDLATDAARLIADLVEHTRREEVPAGHAQA